MSNAVGPCHDFISAGQTACWNRNGVILAKLDAANQGVVCYDVSISQTRIEQLRISQASIFHLDDVFEIYNSAKKHMQSKGLQQWVEEYPVKSDIKKDILKGEMYILLKDSQIIGAINISDEQDEEYSQINWKFDDSKVLVIHRLAILPDFQQKGYARYLMDFAENHAQENHYTSIRLDAYTLNHRVVKFYEQRGYIITGEVYFPFRHIPFYGLEKQLSY
jgi:ribosomal protein S18 acetylase RimI-like enzyme